MFNQVVKLVDFNAIELPIGFPFSISGILVNKKHDIMYVDYDESDLIAGENILVVSPMSRPFSIHLLNNLNKEFKTLHKMTPTSTTKKCVVEGLLLRLQCKMLLKMLGY